MKTIFVNAATQYSADWDMKTLVPDANMRRRMSKIVKMGVATGLRCLAEAQISVPDSIITATAYGCLADSEKFLSSALQTNEQVLPPTPFIQSTFNTIGSHIAILTGCHGYNMTFVDRERSFSDALLDAALEIADGKHLVLLGYADEQTPTLHNIFSRLGYRSQTLPQADSAWFFLLSDKKNEHTIAQVANPTLSPLPNVGSAADFFNSLTQ